MYSACDLPACRLCTERDLSAGGGCAVVTQGLGSYGGKGLPSDRRVVEEAAARRAGCVRRAVHGAARGWRRSNRADEAVQKSLCLATDLCIHL